MKFSLYRLLAAIALAKVSCSPQVMSDVPTVPVSVVPLTPSPLANAAVWHEAVTNDANLGPSSTVNQYFYATVAHWQLLENSSNSIIDNYIAGGASASKFLQHVRMYPTEFDQAQALDPATTQVQISPNPEQTIKSFGASGAWWPNDLNLFPSAQQKNLSKLLFDKNWLYLSGYRYAVGATGDQDGLQIDPHLRAVESFMKTDGTYDWTRDGPGVYYLKAAGAAGVSSITFFINAQPSGMTSNRQACGNSLALSAVPAYAEYIAKVVEYWADQDISIDYISPMNEPDDDFSKCSWGSGCTCGQEGMKVPTDTRTAVFQNVRSALAKSTSAGARKVKIMGDETSQIASQALAEYVGGTSRFDSNKPTSGWLVDTLEGQYIDAIAVHMYDWPDDATLKNYKQLVVNASLQTVRKAPPPPIKMTEISSFASARDVRAPWGQTGPGMMSSEFDPTMDNALDMARMIWQWMTLVNAESFDWWTAVSTKMACSPAENVACAASYQSGSGWNDAFIYLDPSYATNKNYEFYLTKRFWVFKHFTTFVRPGAVRYDIPNEVLPYGTVAMASKGTDDTWNSIFINRNATAQTITLKLPGTGGKLVGITQTDANDDWKSVALPIISNDDTVKIDLPARGVLSLQFTFPGSSQTDSIEVAGKVRKRSRGRLSLGSPTP